MSVVLPTYNRANLLGRAIQSVLNQTYRNFELIIVDDGSKDDTDEVISRFRDPRLIFLQHKSNLGGAAARNTGINKSQGEYIAFLDSDDLWLEEKLEKQIELIGKAPHHIGVVYTGMLRFEGNQIKYYPPPEVKVIDHNIHHQLLKKNFIGTPATLVRRECFQSVGMFDERLPRLQEWELWIRVSAEYDFLFIDQPLVKTYQVDNSISKNQAALISARKIIIGKHLEKFRNVSRDVLAEQYYRLSFALINQGREREGRKYLRKGIKEKAQLKYFLLYAASFVGILNRRND